MTPLEEIAAALARLPDRALVAIDGVDGAGKTTLADRLAPEVERFGRPVLRAGVDGFHNPRALRYRRGKTDPEGFFRDSYDYAALEHYLLHPFRDGAEAVHVARFDHRKDCPAPVLRSAAPSALLILDGIFLHRDELRGWWDHSLFLSVPFETSYARMARRDGSDPDPRAPENRRYFEGQRIYLRNCHPETRASRVILA